MLENIVILQLIVNGLFFVTRAIFLFNQIFELIFIEIFHGKNIENFYFSS